MSLSVLRQTLIPVTLPAAWLYRAVVVARNQLYERGLCEVKQLPAPVVSVGNLTVGGSGKTPLVRRIAHHFLSKGWPVAVLSRGYRRRDNAPFVLVSDGQRLLASSFEAGDEALELARAVKGLAVAVGADRYHVGLELFRRLGPHLVVLDDGFQHRRLFRNLDVVCVDSGEGPHRLRLAPAGRLREPLAGLRRASCLVWTRSDKDRPSARLTSRVLKGMKPELPVFRAFNRITGFTGLGEAAGTLEPDRFQGEPVALLAAIACPERLRADLESLGVRVVWVATRRDHHAWRPKEIQRLLAAAKKSGAGAVLTTGKDAVKLDFLKSAPLPIYQVNFITQVVEAEDFEALLDSVPAP